MQELRAPDLDTDSYVDVQLIGARNSCASPATIPTASYRGREAAAQPKLPRESDVEQRRLVRALESVTSQPAGSLAERLCQAAQTCLNAAGAGVALAADDNALETVCVTGDGQQGESLQSDVGEGPAYSAHRCGWPVLVADLDLDDSWPAFTPAATALGLRGIFAFPLRSGAVRIGALTLYFREVGELSDDNHADALVFARLALDLFLAVQSGRSSDDLDGMFSVGTSNTAQIHQATGIVSVQLGSDVGAALALLRARAYSEQRSLREVADDVIAHRVRLDDDAA